MTTILSIDSSKRFFEISLQKEDEQISNFKSSEPNKHSENLIPQIESLLESNHTSYDDLKSIVVNIGPGSFTSIRAGVSIAIGINLVKKTNLIAVTSFESIAYQALFNSPLSLDTPNEALLRRADGSDALISPAPASPSIETRLASADGGSLGNILVVIDAKREQLFVQILDSNLQSIKEPELIFYDEINNYQKNHAISIICGNGTDLISDIINTENSLTIKGLESNSESILNIAQIKFNIGLTCDKLTPLYIRKPDAKKQNLV